jgi:hypothetical protein
MVVGLVVVEVVVVVGGGGICGLTFQMLSIWKLKKDFNARYGNYVIGDSNINLKDLQ